MTIRIIFRLFLCCGIFILFSCDEKSDLDTGDDDNNLADTLNDDISTGDAESDGDSSDRELDAGVEDCTDEEITDEGTEDDDPEEEIPSSEACAHLFGTPTPKTGLSEEECKPFFNCEGEKFEAATYSQSDIEWLESRIYLNPPAELNENPYDNPEIYAYEPDKLCGIIFQDEEKSTYSLETFDSMEALEKSGAMLTHSGACGHCSSLQSLAVYIKNPELTGPVKSCGAKGLVLSGEKTIRCIMDIGFDRTCAKVWYYNTRNTASQCIFKCLDDLFSTKYHSPDGSLNDCIQCDEDKSGPVFKATSGRTRRNSGLPSALCRPCNTVTPVFHWYK